MTMEQKKGAFIVWKKYQRRVEVLAPYFDLEICYFSYPWEEKSKFYKALSYIPKAISTLKYLLKRKPPLVFIQFPPTPALYCVALYKWLTGSTYVADCHITIGNDYWHKWIYAKKLLLKGKMIVHNNDIVEPVIKSLNIKPIVVRDGIAIRPLFDRRKSILLENLGLFPKSYVIFPCSFSADEPLMIVIEAARSLPETKFVITWNYDRLLKSIRNSLPPNIILTGYLRVDDFNYLFANAGVALVLTTQEAIQLSGVQEAMTFTIPAVVSDLKTTRFLYKEYPVYVKNESISIADGIRYAFQNRLELEERMKYLRIETEKEFDNQIENLRIVLNL